MCQHSYVRLNLKSDWSTGLHGQFKFVYDDTKAGISLVYLKQDKEHNQENARYSFPHRIECRIDLGHSCTSSLSCADTKQAVSTVISI